MNRRLSVWVERALLAVGVACLGTEAFVTLDARRYQTGQKAAFEESKAITRLSAVPAADDAPAPRAGDHTPLQSVHAGTLLGLLDVPRLGLSTPVVQGDDNATLSKAAGHLPDTPLPWQAGNSAVAAHRDTLFRPLKDIAVGDEIRFRTPARDILYRVTRTSIVNPDDVSVLDPGARDRLTLITCYPFYYVGNAPKRFIVHAERE